MQSNLSPMARDSDYKQYASYNKQIFGITCSGLQTTVLILELEGCSKSQITKATC